MIYKSQLNDKYELFQSDGESCYKDVIDGSKLIIDNKVKYILNENNVFMVVEDEKFQCGFYVKDEKVIRKIQLDIFKEDVNLNSEYTDEFIDIIIKYMNTYMKASRVSESILKGAFKEDEKGNGYFRDNDAFLNIKDIEELKDIITKYINDINSLENQDLKGFFNKLSNKENVERLLNMADEDNNIRKLANLNSEDNRIDFCKNAEEEIFELYERLAAFQEEVLGILEEIIAA